MKGGIALFILAIQALPVRAIDCTAETASVDYRNAKPKVLSGPIECAANEVPEGKLNECGVTKYYMEHDPALKTSIEEDVYTPKGVRQQVESHTRALQVSYKSADGKHLEVSTRDFCQFYANEQWALHKTDPVVLLSPNLSIGRTLTDTDDPNAKPIPVPFIASIQQDHDAHQTTTGLYGTLKYDFLHSTSPVLSTLDATLSVDSNTSQDNSKSSVVAGIDYVAITGSNEPADLFQEFSWKVSPQYQTDRDFDRRAYEVTASVAGKSLALGRMGYLTYSNGDPGPDNSFRFFWQPSIGLDIGRVDNAAGNSQLEIVKKDGTYVRLVPSVSAELIPDFISENLVLEFSYRHRYDLTQGWDRGYAELSVLYHLSKNAYLTALYRYGRKDVTFDPINTVLFGIGFSQ
ncbi:MAG: hypothetical protein P4L92_01000 [Rudaea sp.]|nr:hypothetical protein [Rudaea sp.]